MMVSTRGRYALRVLMDLAEHTDNGYTPIKDVAARQDISKKYVEQIIPVFVKNGLVAGVQGKSGGYRLTRSPEEYTVGEILRLAEGDLAPVACLSCNAEPCSRHDKCKTIEMWSRFNDLTNDFFDGITLTDLINDKK